MDAESERNFPARGNLGEREAVPDRTVSSVTSPQEPAMPDVGVEDVLTK